MNCVYETSQNNGTSNFGATSVVERCLHHASPSLLPPRRRGEAKGEGALVEW